MGLEIIILAAGQGKRMHSDLPKVLHCVAGQPMLAHVIANAKKCSPEKIHIVIGHGANQVRQAITGSKIAWCMQQEQLGTGHAVQQALPNINDNQEVLILYGDVPLLTEETLHSLIKQLDNHHLVLLTANLDNPSGYGRVIRDDKNQVTKIVEQKDADQTTLNIKEINTGILATRAKLLKECLSKITNQNAQQEYYLTDCIELAANDNNIAASVCDDQNEVLGINNKQQLASVERLYQLRIANKLMQQGATLIDPARVDVRGELQIEKDVTIDANVIFEGTNQIGEQVSIGSNVILINTTIAAGTNIHPNCHIENSIIGANCEIGPFARIRPDTELANQVKVGNFVEVKKSKINTGSKINHLSYIGDSELGENVNVGAGSITCNYDGANKHRTVIGDNVFIGSDTQFIAPVTIGDGATIGAGSTITKDTPKDKLTLARAKQVTLDNWQRPKKNK